MTSNLLRRGKADDQSDGLGLRSTLGKTRKNTPRQAGSWAAAVLVLALGVLGVYAYTEWRTDTVEVLVLTRDVPPGHTIVTGGSDPDVRTVEVSGVPDAIRASEIDTIAGQRAAVGLVEGQVLTSGQLTDQPVPDAGERLVAVRLDLGRVPAGLDVGDLVNVLLVPAETATADEGEGTFENPKVLTTDARVTGVEDTVDGGRVVTLVIGDGDANRVAAQSAAGRVTIVQAPADGAGE